MAAQLDNYKALFVELQKTTEEIRVMLIVQKTSLESSRAQLNATSQWCNAFPQTC